MVLVAFVLLLNMFGVFHKCFKITVVVMGILS